MNDSVKVDVWSDIACPWCYIGKRKFESGVAAFAATPNGAPVEAEYHPFEPSPDPPVDLAGTAAEVLPAPQGMPVDHAPQRPPPVPGPPASVSRRAGSTRPSDPAADAPA